MMRWIRWFLILGGWWLAACSADTSGEIHRSSVDSLLALISQKEQLTDSLQQQILKHSAAQDSLNSLIFSLQKNTPAPRTVYRSPPAQRTMDSILQANNQLASEWLTARDQLAEAQHHLIQAKQALQDSLKTLRQQLHVAQSAPAQAENKTNPELAKLQNEVLSSRQQADSLKSVNNSLQNQSKYYVRQVSSQQQEIEQLKAAIQQQPQPAIITDRSSDSLRMVTASLRQQIVTLQCELETAKAQPIAQATIPVAEVATSELEDSLLMVITNLQARLQEAETALQIQKTALEERQAVRESSTHQPLSANDQVIESYRLVVAAKDLEPTDPTLAFQLMREASRLNLDPNIRQEMNRLYASNFIYRELYAGAPVAGIAAGADRMLIRFRKDTATYFAMDENRSLRRISAFKDVKALDLLPGKKLILLGHSDGFISMYHIDRETVVKKHKTNDGPITAVTLLGNSNYFFATGSADKSVAVYNGKYQRVTKLVGMLFPVRSMSIAHKTGQVAVACGDDTPRVWNLDGKMLLKLSGQPDSTQLVAISPQGDQFVSVHADRKARLWRVSDGALISVFGGHGASMSAVAYSPDGKRIVTADSQGIIYLRDYLGNIRAELKGHTAEVVSLLFLESNILLSASADGTVKSWQLDRSQATNPDEVHELSAEQRTRFSIRSLP